MILITMMITMGHELKGGVSAGDKWEGVGGKEILPKDEED
jgi:hypothetical protein